MPNAVTARHRAGGVGRLIAWRTASPRHGVAAARMRWWRWPVGFTVVAVLGLAAVTPLTLREPGAPRFAVPLPRVSVPEPAVTPSPSASRRPLQAVRQAAKPQPPVLLGPAGDADLPALLGSYCRATHGPVTLAVSDADGWVCAPLGRDPVPLDLDAMCRWRYGPAAWADLGRETDPRSWRCYRDGP